MIWFSNKRHQQKNIKERVRVNTDKELELYKNTIEINKACAQLVCVPC